MAHHSTTFPQLLKLAPRHGFEAPAKRRHRWRRRRSMTRWAQFGALALGQLSGRCGRRGAAADLWRQGVCRP